MHKKLAFCAQKSKKFLGRVHSPSPDSSPSGKGDTLSPHFTPSTLGAFGVSILAPTALDTLAFGAPPPISNRNRRHCGYAPLWDTLDLSPLYWYMYSK